MAGPLASAWGPGGGGLSAPKDSSAAAKEKADKSDFLTVALAGLHGHMTGGGGEKGAHSTSHSSGKGGAEPDPLSFSTGPHSLGIGFSAPAA